MSASLTNAAPTANPDLARAVARFEGLGRELLGGYEALARRAERVERELEVANAALESKVAELGRVTRDLEALLEALPLGVVVRDPSGAVTRANPAAAELLGRELADVLVGAADRDVAELAASDGPVQRTDASGAVRTLSMRTADVPAGADRAPGQVCLIDDQTEVRRLAARLHTQDKMAALGTLAAGVAHEIRNPLSAVLGFASLLARDLPVGSRGRRWAELIVTGATETDQIVSGLLTFAAPGNVRLEAVELAPLVDEVVASSLARLERPERWSVDIDVPPIAVLADRVKLRQGLRNLVANAFDAQPKGGRIAVSGHTDGRGLRLVIDDAGPGVRDEDRERLLEPFFTTRATGTGLGLALTHTVARLHGGSLEPAAERSPLGGARFVLQLPPDCLPADAR